MAGLTDRKPENSAFIDLTRIFIFTRLRLQNDFISILEKKMEAVES